MGTIQWIRCTTYQDTTGKCIWSVPLIATGCIRALPAEAGIPNVSRIRSSMCESMLWRPRSCADCQFPQEESKCPLLHTRLRDLYDVFFIYFNQSYINLNISSYHHHQDRDEKSSYTLHSVIRTSTHVSRVHSLLNIVDTFTFEIRYSSFLRVICYTIESPLKNKEFCPFSQIA